MSLKIEKLGFAPDFVDYSEALELQQKIHAKVAAEEQQNTVLLLEHQPVITAGKRTEDHEYPVGDSIPVVKIDRGGKLTWHGPGQLVGYPIVRLPEPIDVVRYVRICEDVMIEILAELGIDGQRVEGRSGVWILREGQQDRKIAQIGIRVAQNTTMHGFAINCSNDLDPFSSFVPCGITDAGVTSISDQLGKTVNPADIVDLVEQKLQDHADQLAKVFTPTGTEDSSVSLPWAK